MVVIDKHTLDRISCATHVLDFFTGSVGGARVGHGVTTISVSGKFHHKRTLARGGPFLGPLASTVDSKNIHTVDTDTKKVNSTMSQLYPTLIVFSKFNHKRTLTQGCSHHGCGKEWRQKNGWQKYPYHTCCSHKRRLGETNKMSAT